MTDLKKSKQLFRHVISNLAKKMNNVMRARGALKKIGTRFCSFLKMGAMSLETFGVYFAASMVMHSIGLYSLIKKEGGFRNVVQAIAGAGLEGVLIFLIILALLPGCQEGLREQGSYLSSHYWSDRYAPELSKNFRYYNIIPSIISIFLAVSIVAFSMLIITSDYLFQKKVGGRPDMWVIIVAFKDCSSLLKSEISSNKGEFIRLIMGIASITFLTFIICLLQFKRERKQGVLPEKRTSRYCKYYIIQNYLSFPTIFLLLVCLYAMNSWMPVYHAVASLLSSFYMVPPAGEIRYRMAKINHPVNEGKSWPNVVVAMHESLSGEYMLTRESSLKTTSFFTKMLRSEDRFYVFEHARTVSGDTVDALTAIQSGCLPLDHNDGRDIALSTSLATEFKRRGFDTVSFTSRALTMKSTKWFMIQKQLSENFDEVFHPGITKESIVNPPAVDDRTLKKYFKEWLNKRAKSGITRPFYAQFYYFNAHYPFLDNKDRSNSTSRADGMLKTVDETIENMFQVLNESEQLDNTMVIGSGDHGENYLHNEGEEYMRLKHWNKNIFRPPMYIHMPRDFLLSGNNATTMRENFENLRYNTYQLTSTLDIFPTILHVLEGKVNTEYTVTNDKCVRGLDLFAQRIKPSRVAWSFPGVNSNFENGSDGNLALHTGTSSSIYRRSDGNFSVVQYDNIPVGYSNHPKSKKEREPLTLLEWKSVVQKLLHNEQVDGAPLRKGCDLVAEFLAGVKIIS